LLLGRITIDRVETILKLAASLSVVVRDGDRDRDGGIIVAMVRTRMVALGWFHGDCNRKI
jgi:hypothetical protein